MTIHPILTAPDPRLAICSAEVTDVNDEIRALMDDMLETMYASEGIGLAAVQIGVHKRIVVMDLGYATNRYEPNDPTKEYKPTPIYLVNPEIAERSEEQNIYEEGCLSFPGQFSKVMRPKQVTVKYLDYWGKPQSMSCDGLLATCIQHEIDHLNGVVFVDHISKLKRDLIMRRLEKWKKRG